MSFIVVGLAYGDEGKGSIVDWLTRKHGIKYVVRFNGGSQAAHHVVTQDTTHCFSQFGSGTLAEARTILSQNMLVDPLTFLEEARVLKSKNVAVEGMVLVDENCPIVTPFNMLLNRIAETSRRFARHGSCGRGIGVTQNDVDNLGEKAFYIRDLFRAEGKEKFNWLWKTKLKQAEEQANSDCQQYLDIFRRIDLEKILQEYAEFLKLVRVVSQDEVLEIIRSNECVFEAAQGVLLDQKAGFFPYITRSNTSFVNALELLEQSGYQGSVEKIGLLRAYSCRHGPGPFVAEDHNLKLEPCHNQTNMWQGNFRLGWFDCVTARYALRVVGGVDKLMITNLDRFDTREEVRICKRYSHTNPEFFDEYGELRVGNWSYEELARRTEMMKQCKPYYLGLGWDNSDSCKEDYLSLLEELLGRRIEVFSISPTADGKKERSGN